jgi:hypothetical protein
MMTENWEELCTIWARLNLLCHKLAAEVDQEGSEIYSLATSRIECAFEILTLARQYWPTNNETQEETWEMN